MKVECRTVGGWGVQGSDCRAAADARIAVNNRMQPALRIFVFVMSGAFKGAEEKVLKGVERRAMIFGNTFYFLEAVVEFVG